MSFFKSKSKKSIIDAPRIWLEPPNCDAKMVQYNWRELVASPPGIPEGEWVASHTGPFFRTVNTIYASLCDFCTATTCPSMTAGSKVEFIWTDEKGKKMKGLTAPQYIDYVCSHMQSVLDDDAVFPTSVGVPLPKDFLATNKRLYRLLFNVFAHIYYHHYDALLRLGEVPHLNSLFTHFIFFAQTHLLLDSKDTGCLAELIAIITR